MSDSIYHRTFNNLIHVAVNKTTTGLMINNILILNFGKNVFLRALELL